MVDSGAIILLAGKSRRTSNGKESVVVRRRYQGGCLFKRGRKNKVWVGRWREVVMRPDGSICRVQRSEVIASVKDLSTRREAQILFENKLKDLNQGWRKLRVAISFGEFAKQWEDAVLPTYRESTRNFYADVLKRHLVPYFKNWELSQIRKPDIQAFVNQKAQRYSPSVLCHIRATLSRVLATACDWEYLDSNPVPGVRVPKKQNVRPNVAFPAKDVARLVGHLAEPYRTMVAVASLTGMRASEIFALSWEDLDFRRRWIFVRRSFYHGAFGPPKTPSSERSIPMTAKLAEVLQAHCLRTKCGTASLVFANSMGKPYEPSSLVRRVLRPAQRALGLPEAGWRAFRRSVATALSELREPVRAAQQVLGHSSPTTTLAIYTQGTEVSQRKALKNLERLLFPNVPKFENARSGRRQLVN